MVMTPEHKRLSDAREGVHHWRRWGPYLSERQWATVREDTSDHGHSWSAFPHDQARSRAYRWGEDGLQGWCDRQCRLCFAPALWNGQDEILKERLFGLAGHEGNHGEDVKECYFYLDSSPTHSYTKALYKYPQRKFPYTALLEENQKIGRSGPELELADMGVFDEGRYFDVTQEVAKRSPEDLLWRITITNRGPVAAPIHVLPTLWFRNTWSWGEHRDKPRRKPLIRANANGLTANHETLGKYRFIADCPQHAGTTSWLFTDNESHPDVPGGHPHTQYPKDAFHRYLIHGEKNAVSPHQRGTKAAAHVQALIPPGASITIRCRLHAAAETHGIDGLDQFDETFAERIAECDAFYRELIPAEIPEQEQLISRQGYAGLLWTKQFYHYIIDEWIRGGESQPPSAERMNGRNSDWHHFHARDILSMPDKWEYPWFAAWDSAFHMIPFASVDPDFAKDQLLLLLREWYMHPNGQLPAYEWNFSDVNPPVHAWAVWRVYKIADPKGKRDLLFL
ncbi:MAG: MGH1-like glycoside hydrolase domain-containing protein, partial [Luteolibacter sp.]